MKITTQTLLEIDQALRYLHQATLSAKHDYLTKTCNIEHETWEAMLRDIHHARQLTLTIAKAVSENCSRGDKTEVE